MAAKNKKNNEWWDSNRNDLDNDIEQFSHAPGGGGGGGCLLVALAIFATPSLMFLSSLLS